MFDIFYALINLVKHGVEIVYFEKEITIEQLIVFIRCCLSKNYYFFTLPVTIFHVIEIQ